MAEMGRGVESCKSCKWPPTLPEFLLLCRPPVNYERAFLEAMDQMARRDANGSDTWSSPAVFWALGALGPDVKAVPYHRLAARWEYALDVALADVAAGRLGAVPARPVAIAYAPRGAPVPADIRELLRSLKLGTVRAGDSAAAP